MTPQAKRSPLLRLPRVALLAAILLASLTTARGLVSGQAPAEGPLAGGRWETTANGDRISRMLHDESEIWSATDGGGVLRWSLVDRSARQYLSPQDGLASNQVWDLARDAQNRLWAATERGLSRYDEATDRWLTITPESSEDMPARVVRALLPASEGGLWVGFGQEWDPERPHPRTGAPGAFAPGGLARYLPDEDRWTDHFVAEIESDLQGSRYISLASDNITRLAYGSDGILWVGTQPYYLWDRSACGDECRPEDGAWIRAGGGLAAYQGGEWARWSAADSSASCYPSHVTDLAADIDGRMWVGTLGRGLLVLRQGLTVRSCAAGLAYYTEPRRATIEGGLRGNTVWSVDVAPDGKVWIGHGEGNDVGQGIAILDHKGTFSDSSACESCQSDDDWSYVDLDGATGESDALITELILTGLDEVLLGTRDHRKGDGDGIRRFRPSQGSWEAFRSADGGLPSNHIRAVAVNPVDGALWLSFERRGVARFDGQRWQGWRMFGAGPQVGSVTLASRAGYALLQVDIPDREAYQERFPVQPASVRVAEHPIVYSVKRYKDPAGNTPAYLELSPPLIQPVSAGDAIRVVDRGPASDASTQIAFTPDGSVWIGGRETVWLGNNCPSDRKREGECWLDGGVSRYDGQHWRNFDEAGSQIPDQEVQAVTVDPAGQVWVGTGDGGSEGDGIGVYNPQTASWTVYERSTMPGDSRMGSNGVADFAIDPENGDIWTAHHAVVQFTQNLGGSWSRSYIGGGVSRWDGSRWTTWSKPSANLKAFGVGGDVRSLLVDRGHGRIWAGTWSPAESFHWLQGYGINASLNWCALEACGNQDWQSKVWPGDGIVAALEQDARGQVWAGTHRNGAGTVPPVAGVKLYDGGQWFEYTSENSGLVSSEITALAREGESMWIGTLGAGLSRWSPALPPTATPSPAPASVTPPPSIEPSPTALATRPTATRTPDPSPCRAGRPCPLYLPVIQLQASCLGCGRSTATRPPATATLGPGSPQPSATATRRPSATSTPRPGTTPSATPVTPTPTERARQSETPSPTSTRTPTATPTATSTASASPTATHQTELAPIGTWSVYDPGPLARLPRENLYDVDGTSVNDVWLIGAGGTALYWDGTQLLQETLPAQSDLRRVQMLSQRRGFIAGDEGTALEMRSGRWVRANTNAVIDDWRGLAVFDTLDGPRGWLMGAGRGNRLYFDGSSWNTTSPDDRNTGHGYSGVAMLGPNSAVSIQSSGGGRLYDWDGERWWPGSSVGPMRDVHVPVPGMGVMGGDNGSVYRMDEAGQWSSLPAKPVTRGTPIYSLHMLAEDRIYASAGQNAIFTWDGEQWRTQRILGAARDIFGIWVSPDATEGWAVGTGGLILRYEAP